MGSAGSKPRKKQQHLSKVPKYGVPNRIEGAGAGGFGRDGHSSDHHHGYAKPTGFGAWMLKVLGRKPRP